MGSTPITTASASASASASATPNNHQQGNKQKQKLNLESLNGLRCIASISIILLHTHYFFGALFYPYDESCLQALSSAKLPIIGPLLFNNSFQMPLFWILSGFLCEFQLDRLATKNNNAGASLTRAQYTRFLFNRFLRLYPLYCLFNLINFVVQSANDKGTGKCDDVTKLVESLFFVLKSEPRPAAACAGAGWSVMVDVHGYFVLVFLHFSCGESIRRRVLLPLLYTTAISLMGLHAWQFLETKDLVRVEHVQTMFSGAAYSLQYQNDQDLVLVKVMSGGIDVRELWADKYEFNTEFWNQIVTLRHEILDANYFASVHKNGSSIFLGSLLYLNIKRRMQQTGTAATATIVAIVKVAVAVILLEVTSYSWMLSGFPVYLLVDSVLSLTQEENQPRWSLFSNPLWTSMSPYTYGIYMSHVFVLAISTSPIYKNRAARMMAGESVTDDYSFIFIMAAALFMLAVSWVCAIGLYHTVEWPARYYRTQYTSSSAVAGAMNVAKKII